MRVVTVSVFVLLAASIAWTKPTSRGKDYPRGKDPDDSSRNRNSLLSFLIKFLSQVLGTPNTSTKPVREADNEISVLTFNILAPIYVDEMALKATGVVDMNLLDKDIRLGLAIRKILEIDADIVVLQEVMSNTYEVIKRRLSNTYKAQPFAPHGPEHWREFVQGQFVENGMGTFFKKDKFVSLSNEIFFTSDNGNAADVSVLRRTRNKVSEKEVGPPILLANVHFQSEFGAEDSFLRVTQSSAMIEHLSNRTKELQETFPGMNPVVIMAGDMNSIIGAPGLNNILSKGYTSVKDAVNNTLDSHFFTSVIDIQVFPPFDGVSIDKIMVPTADIDSGRIAIKSVSIPDVRVDPSYEESPYIRRAIEMIVENVKRGYVNEKKATRQLRVLQDSLNDGNEYDTPYNRAIRVGSDHLPLYALLEIKD